MSDPVPLLHCGMLTRSQVAKRIGRSLATVRRLEGSALHPEVDSRGIHRFDEREVAAVARSVKDTGTARRTHTDSAPDGQEWDEVTESYQDTDTMQSWRDLQKRARDAEGQLLDFQTQVELERMDFRQFKRDVDRACAGLISSLNTPSQRTQEAIAELLSVWETHKDRCNDQPSTPQSLFGE